MRQNFVILGLLWSLTIDSNFMNTLSDRNLMMYYRWKSSRLWTVSLKKDVEDETYTLVEKDHERDGDQTNY